MRKFLFFIFLIFFIIGVLVFYLFFIGIGIEDIVTPLKSSIYIEDVFETIPASSAAYLKIIGGKNIIYALDEWEAFEVVENKSSFCMLKEMINDYKEKIEESVSNSRFAKGVIKDLLDICSKKLYFLCGFNDDEKNVRPWFVLVSELNTKKRWKFLFYSIVAHMLRENIKINKIGGEKVFNPRIGSSLDFKLVIKNNLLFIFVNCSDAKVRSFLKICDNGKVVKINKKFNSKISKFYETNGKDINFWVDWENFGEILMGMNNNFVAQMNAGKEDRILLESLPAEYTYAKIVFGENKIICNFITKVNMENENLSSLYMKIKENTKLNSRFLNLFEKSDTVFFYNSCYLFKEIINRFTKMRERLSKIVKDKSMNAFQNIDFTKLKSAFGDVLLFKIWERDGKYKFAGIQKEDGDIIREFVNISSEDSKNKTIMEKTIKENLRNYFKRENGYIFFGIDKNSMENIWNLFNFKSMNDYRKYVSDEEAKKCIFLYRFKPKKICEKILKSLDKYLQVDPDTLPKGKREISNYLYMLDITGVLEMYFTSYIEALTYIDELYLYGILNRDFTISSKCVIINGLKKSKKD